MCTMTIASGISTLEVVGDRAVELESDLLCLDNITNLDGYYSIVKKSLFPIP